VTRARPVQLAALGVHHGVDGGGEHRRVQGLKCVEHLQHHRRVSMGGGCECSAARIITITIAAGAPARTSATISEASAPSDSTSVVVAAVALVW
jgi:hypothetical protein